jgi:ferredoxin
MPHQRATISFDIQSSDTDTYLPDELVEHLRKHPSIVGVTYAGTVEGPRLVEGPDRAKLIELATWLAGQHALQQLGLPSEWNQASWLSRRSDVPCGTTACAAGHVFLRDGGQPAAVYRYGDRTDDWTQAVDGYDWSRGTINGQEVSVREYAITALRLPVDQAGALFDGNNDYPTMLELIGQLLAVAEPTIEPAEVDQEVSDAFPADGSTTTTVEQVVTEPLDVSTRDARVAERINRPLRRRLDGTLVRAREPIQGSATGQQVCRGGVECQMCYVPVEGVVGVTLHDDGKQEVRLSATPPATPVVPF